MSTNWPERIVCLTEETTEFIYALGEEERIVGISAYTCRPPQAKEEKPIVSAFVGGSVKKIKALAPDLVIGFSDVQADLAKDLVKENLQVLITNQRSIAEILDVLSMFGRLLGVEEKAEELVNGYRNHINTVKSARQHNMRPRVYFEEWDDPMISAIEWVSELIEIAGGNNIFSDRAAGKRSSERFVSSDEIIARAPEIYIGCWCGKPLDRYSVEKREGFDSVPAIANGDIFEMDPALILQPGPASLTEGLDALCKIIDKVRND